MINDYCEFNLKYGDINIKLKEVMDEKHISIYKLSKMSYTKYDVVKRYYYGDVINYNSDVLAKFCHALDCNLNDILVYVPR